MIHESQFRESDTNSPKPGPACFIHPSLNPDLSSFWWKTSFSFLCWMCASVNSNFLYYLDCNNNRKKNTKHLYLVLDVKLLFLFIYFRGFISECFSYKWYFESRLYFALRELAHRYQPIKYVWFLFNQEQCIIHWGINKKPNKKCTPVSRS